MKKLHRIGLLSFVAFAATSCRRPNAQIAFGDSVPLSVATTVGTAPMFAVSPTGQRAVAWVSAPGGGTDGRLYVSVSGRSPAEIRDALGPIEAHGEAPPKLAYAPDGSLFAVYTVGKVIQGERFPKSALRIVRSGDAGKTWSAPVTVTDGAVFGSHSFHALHVAANGTVYVSWLGKPDDTPAAMPVTMASMGGGDHAAHESSAAWIARSVDGGRTWSTRVRVDHGEACPCCRTSVVTGRDGTLYMAWRHVFAGNVRDIVVARSSDQGITWSDPVRVHADDWHFDACPHAGPAIALDSSGTLHVVWWTGKEGSAGVFYARSTDGGKSFADAIPLGVAQYSRPAHVQLALGTAGRVIATWDDGTTQIPEVVLRVSNDGGAHFGDPITLSSPRRAATFPVLGVSGDSVAVAWTDETPAEASQAAPEAVSGAARSKAPQGLHPVGEAQVVMRTGVLR